MKTIVQLDFGVLWQKGGRIGGTGDWEEGRGTWGGGGGRGGFCGPLLLRDVKASINMDSSRQVLTLSHSVKREHTL